MSKTLSFYKWFYGWGRINLDNDLIILKFILSLLFIFNGFILISSQDFYIVSNIIAGTGFALLISVIFEGFEIKKQKIIARNDFLDELSIDIQNLKYTKNIRDLKDKILLKIRSLDARPEPRFLRGSNSVEKIYLISELFKDNVCQIDKELRFILKPSLSIIFNEMSHPSLIRKSNKNLRENLTYSFNYINKKGTSVIEDIYWAFHGDFDDLAIFFLVYLNNLIENHLEKHGKNYSINLNPFIKMYVYIANSSICNARSWHRDKQGFKKNDLFYTYYGFSKGVSLAIDGLNNLKKLFPEEEKKIDKEIEQIKENEKEVDKIEKFDNS